VKKFALILFFLLFVPSLRTAPLFACEKIWTDQTFSVRANELAGAAHEGKILYDRLERYEELTGIKIDLALEQDLPSYLASKGLKTSELKRLGGGIQGTLFTHPGMPGEVIKVFNFAMNGMVAFHQIGESHDFIPEYDPKGPVATMIRHKIEEVDREWATEKVAQRRFGFRRETLHKVYPILELGILAEESKMPYFDFMRIHALGNYFVVREYYPDSTLRPSDGMKMLKSIGKTPEDILQDTKYLEKNYPLLLRMSATLIFQIPSAFVSKTLFEQTKDSPRPRVFVIYDLD
jgi:hypothetical protein